MKKTIKRKKSSKEKRVLIVSLAMAGTLIAGSTFAWFTSKDEVTNRLTANADYGVSIVESFAPPANWLPGQTVNKDVYDVNTGNIAAFVKNDVKGVLNYTYESKVAARDADCIKLNESQVTAIDGVTTNEGGGFLAWTDAAGVNVGAVNSARTGDAVANTWHPTVEGVYIFRRSIGGTAAAPTFTYAGYYFDGTSNYYKIVIGDDNYRAETTTTGTPNNVGFDLATPEAAITGVEIDRSTGEITTGTPKVWYVKDTQVTDANVTFKLDDTNKRLVVEYATAMPTVDDGGNTYDAVADAARKEVDYINKLGVSNSAFIDYHQKDADYTYSAGLKAATDALYAAAVTRNTASTTATTAAADLETAWNNLKADATATRTTWLGAVNTYKTTLSVNAIVPATVQATILGDPALTACKDNLAEMQTLETEITNIVDEINDKYDQLYTMSTVAGLSADQVESIIADCKLRLDTLSTKLTAYKNAYAGLTSNAAVASELVSAGAADITTTKNAIAGLATQATTLKTSLDAARDDYRTAWNANASAATADTSAATAWHNAIVAYNTEVARLKNNYDLAIAQTVPNPQDPGSPVAAYTNKGATLVGTYAAASAVGDDPTVDLAAAVAAFATYATYPAILAPDATLSAAALTAYTNANTATTTAKNAYDNAVLVLDSSTKITLYVNLDPAYATNWTMDRTTDATTTVSFYLNSILDAAETSDKLIDDVTFADSVTAKDFKDLTFDLNINLDSAQITYADDQTTIKTDAVVSPTFGLKPTLTDATDINTAITWK